MSVDLPIEAPFVAGKAKAESRNDDGRLLYSD
jgi:hypothetical protein